MGLPSLEGVLELVSSQAPIMDNFEHYGPLPNPNKLYEMLVGLVIML